MTRAGGVPSLAAMTRPAASRPTAIWIAVALLAVLSFLSAVGGFIFNLSGADEAGEVAVGLVFVALAAAYAYLAARLPAGGERRWQLALVLVTVHGLFNAIVKVGMEREASSLMFVVLTAAIALLLLLPASRAFYGSRGTRHAPA